MSGHTAAPWEAIRDEAHRRIVVRAGLAPLAELWMVGQPEEQRMADARLIAAAPELLAALQALLAQSDYSYMDAANLAYEAEQGNGAIPAIQHARAAISKATGGQ